MRLGVIADTHIPKKAKVLPEKVFEAFRDVDLIIHAGDVMVMDVIYKLEQLAPVEAVAGNNDQQEIIKRFEFKKIITLEGFHIGIFHGDGQRGKTVDRAFECFKNDTVDCIIFGHSHIPYCQYHDGILLFNPGSPTDKRRNLKYSFGIIDIGITISPQIVYF